MPGTHFHYSWVTQVLQPRSEARSFAVRESTQIIYATQATFEFAEVTESLGAVEPELTKSVSYISVMLLSLANEAVHLM